MPRKKKPATPYDVRYKVKPLEWETVNEYLHMANSSLAQFTAIHRTTCWWASVTVVGRGVEGMKCDSLEECKAFCDRYNIRLATSDLVEA